MGTGLTVNYAHCWDSMYKGIDSSGPYYKISYYIKDWSQSDTVANQLRGYTTRMGTSTLRTPPHQHPLSTNLVCTDVTIEGVGNAVLGPTGYPAYDNGFLAHATYRSIPWMPYATNDPDGNNQIDPTSPILWCTQEIDFEDETYVLENNTYIWASDSTKSKIPVKVTLGVTTINLTFHQLPYLPMGSIRTYRNCVNSTTMWGQTAGKIWFKGCKTTRELNTDGTMCQTVFMQFKERDQAWNKYLRSDGTWDYLKDGSANYILPAADLTQLFSI